MGRLIKEEETDKRGGMPEQGGDAGGEKGGCWGKGPLRTEWEDRKQEEAEKELEAKKKVETENQQEARGKEEARGEKAAGG